MGRDPLLAMSPPYPHPAFPLRNECAEQPGELHKSLYIQGTHCATNDFNLVPDRGTAGDVVHPVAVAMQHQRGQTEAADVRIERSDGQPGTVFGEHDAMNGRTHGAVVEHWTVAAMTAQASSPRSATD